MDHTVLPANTMPASTL